MLIRAYNDSVDGSARRPLTEKQTVLVLLALVGLLIVYLATKPAQISSTQAQPQDIGQTRRLINPNGGPGVTLFATKADLDAAVRATALGDQVGAADAERNAKLVPVGANVLVLDTGFAQNQPARQIRVTSGPFSGQAGWVLANALAP